MADCAYVMHDGERCRSWLPSHREHCDFHHNMLLQVITAYREIVDWCDKKYGGVL